MTHNGYVYETFGISKHFPVKLQALLIVAETLNNPLTAKCFIYDVMHWRFNSFIKSICKKMTFDYISIIYTKTFSKSESAQKIAEILD